MGLLNFEGKDSKIGNHQINLEPSNHVIRSKVNGCKQTIYTAGRPPWYTADGELNEPFLIGICGGSASGKTTVAQNIIKNLNIPWVSLVCMDSFYKVLNAEQRMECQKSNFNFDHPSAFDIELLVEKLRKLKKGKKVEIPIYDFSTHSRINRTKTIYGANVIIFEGILSFVTTELRELMDLKIFVNTDADIRLARRLLRDISERGRDLNGVMDQYQKFVKPSYYQFIAPSMEFADIIVPRGGQNDVALSVIVQHITKQLNMRGTQLRSQQATQYKDVDISDLRSFSLLPPTNQVKVLQTVIRDHRTARDEFVFYSERLMRILCEFSMSFLPHKDINIKNSFGEEFVGRTVDIQGICGVSIMRAGETMEMALRDVCKDVRIGKILIQSNPETQEPELHYSRLPKDIKNYRVIVMDPTVASGAAAVMAIRVILEHEVPEENIIMLSLLVAEQGIKTIAYNYPKVQIIAAAVDKDLSDDYHIRPGFGNFGNRYFGTDEDETA